MLTAVYVSLDAPQMINYTATHSLVRDGKHSHLRSGTWQNMGSHEGKDYLSVILMEYIVFHRFLEKLSNILNLRFLFNNYFMYIYI